MQPPICRHTQSVLGSVSVSSLCYKQCWRSSLYGTLSIDILVCALTLFCALMVLVQASIILARAWTVLARALTVLARASTVVTRV